MKATSSSVIMSRTKESDPRLSLKDVFRDALVGKSLFACQLAIGCSNSTLMVLGIMGSKDSKSTEPGASRGNFSERLCIKRLRKTD